MQERKRGRGDKDLGDKKIEAVGSGVRSGELRPCDCEHEGLYLKIPLFGGSWM